MINVQIDVQTSVLAGDPPAAWVDLDDDGDFRIRQVGGEVAAGAAGQDARRDRDGGWIIPRAAAASVEQWVGEVRAVTTAPARRAFGWPPSNVLTIALT